MRVKSKPLPVQLQNRVWLDFAFPFVDYFGAKNNLNKSKSINSLIQINFQKLSYLEGVFESDGDIIVTIKKPDTIITCKRFFKEWM